MEFNGMINRLLQNDPAGRARKLRLRTYAVICLNEECGVLEWVQVTINTNACSFFIFILFFSFAGRVKNKECWVLCLVWNCAVFCRRKVPMHATGSRSSSARCVGGVYRTSVDRGRRPLEPNFSRKAPSTSRVRRVVVCFAKRADGGVTKRRRLREDGVGQFEARQVLL